MERTYNIDKAALFKKRQIHIILPVFLVSIIAYLDRVNVSYAGMTMSNDLPWLNPEVFGLGAGIFFIGYFLFEIPGALIAQKFDACKWIARIMFTWGLVCFFMGFIDTKFEFYACRFLLGLCEASLYPTLYAVFMPRWFMVEERAKAISLMLTSLLVSAIIGAPVAGTLLELNLFGLHGWQTLFILEGVPAMVFAFVFFFFMKDRPEKVNFLTDEEKRYLIETFEEEQKSKAKRKAYSVWQALTDKMVWYLVLIFVLWDIGFWGFTFWMPQALKTISGWSPSTVGLIIALPMSIALICQIWLGGHSSKTGEKRWHLACPLFLGAFGLILAPFITDPIGSLVVITITAIGVYIGFGIWFSIPTTFLSGAAAAGSTALINSLGNLGGFTGPYLMGLIKTYTGSYTYGYFVFASFLIISALLMLTLKQFDLKASKK